MGKGFLEIEYHSKDFDFEKLCEEIEQNPLFSYHFVISESIQSQTLPSRDSHAWNNFHTRHKTGKFFKERKYILKEFPELLACDIDAKVLEIGCGNGSTVLPILRGNETINVYACDCSSEALKRAQDMIDAAGLVTAKDRFHPFPCDFSVNVEELDDISSMDGLNCSIGGVDFVTLIFTLSAVPFPRMTAAIAACFSVLKPGGMLLFRDYGLYDMTMLRFEKEKKVGFREYIRSDGTRSYFFSLDIVKDLFLHAGFTEVELEYCCVKSVNRRSGKIMRRVWVHGKFQKP